MRPTTTYYLRIATFVPFWLGLVWIEFDSDLVAVILWKMVLNFNPISLFITGRKTNNNSTTEHIATGIAVLSLVSYV